jgi:hypothetical protein
MLEQFAERDHTTISTALMRELDDVASAGFAGEPCYSNRTSPVARFTAKGVHSFQ